MIESDALLLRQQGYNYEEVARQLQLKYKFTISPAMANSAVKRALARIRKEGMETAREVVDLETSRLDQLFMFAMNRVRQGNLEAIGQALKIMERRAKLHGLDSAQKAHITTGPAELDLSKLPTEKLVELERLLNEASETNGDDVDLSTVPDYASGS